MRFAPIRGIFTFLLFCSSLFGIKAAAQTYPDIHSSRPRIYIDSARFAWLSSNLSSGDCGTTYTQFINAVNNNWYNDPQLYLLGTDSSVWTWDFNSRWAPYQGKFVPAIYKLTGDSTALKRCRFLITQINNRMDTLNFANYSWFANEDIIRDLADVGGMLLDWCYDDLPVPMRQHLAQSLYKADRYFMNTYILSSAGNSYVSSHNAWNTVFANQYALVLDSADGLTALQHDTVQYWYEVTYDKFINGFFPCYGHYRDDDGGWNWTAAYSMWSLVDQFQLFENMRIATGKNFYTDLPWVQQSINQYWYFIQPDDWTINWGDGFTKIQGDRVIYLHARYYNDPRSLWLAQHWSQPANITWTWPLFQKLMYKDFNMPVVAQPDPSHDWWSDKTGLSVSRTGWDTTSTLVWLYNAPNKKSAHDHRDNNSFCVYRNAPQIIHSGYYDAYGTQHYINYYMRTIAHNSICVYDSADQYTNWNVNVSNDGGQTESPTLMNYNDIFSPQAQKGKWILWGSGNNYSYTITDAALSYDSLKLDRYTRRLFFYKPDHVLVLDHVHLNNTTTAQRRAKFVLHFQQQPQISGNIISTEVPGHIETFGGNDIYQANGNGNVAIRSLLPAAATTTRIGGSGYEFYVDGVNYPPSTTMDTIHTTPGKWRIETTPQTVTDSLVFFHTIKIGDSNQPAAAGGIAQQNTHTIGADWENTLFMFSAVGDTGVNYQIMTGVAGGRTVTVVAADLKPGPLHAVLLNSSLMSYTYPDSVGVLITQLNLPAGTHQVEILQLPNTTGNDFTLAETQIFPNPASNELFVTMPNTTSPAVLEIINQLGQIVLSQTVQNSSRIDVKTLPEGHYAVTLSSNGKSSVSKLVIAR